MVGESSVAGESLGRSVFQEQSGHQAAAECEVAVRAG